MSRIFALPRPRLFHQARRSTLFAAIALSLPLAAFAGAPVQDAVPQGSNFLPRDAKGATLPLTQLLLKSRLVRTDAAMRRAVQVSKREPDATASPKAYIVSSPNLRTISGMEATIRVSVESSPAKPSTEGAVLPAPPAIAALGYEMKLLASLDKKGEADLHLDEALEKTGLGKSQTTANAHLKDGEWVTFRLSDPQGDRYHYLLVVQITVLREP